MRGCVKYIIALIRPCAQLMCFRRVFRTGDALSGASRRISVYEVYRETLAYFPVSPVGRIRFFSSIIAELVSAGAGESGADRVLQDRIQLRSLDAGVGF